MNILWRAQVLAIIRLELKNTFFARRGLWIYFLAFAPAALFLAHSLVEIHLRGVHQRELGQESHVFAAVFQFFFLRLAIFFGCLGIFMNLFRGEVLNKSLHFYLLAPVRREILVLGKYLAGLLAAIVIFTTSTVVQIAAMLIQFDSSSVSQYLYQSHGIAQILTYVGVTVLACVGYGTVFLAAGLLFRNPIIPAAFVLIWEAANPILPSLLKKISVIYYLKSLCPVQIPIDPGMPPLITLLVSNPQPISAYIAVFGLLLLSIAVLTTSMRLARRLEINYMTE